MTKYGIGAVWSWLIGMKVYRMQEIAARLDLYWDKVCNSASGGSWDIRPYAHLRSGREGTYGENASMEVKSEKFCSLLSAAETSVESQSGEGSPERMYSEQIPCMFWSCEMPKTLNSQGDISRNYVPSAPHREVPLLWGKCTGVHKPPSISTVDWWVQVLIYLPVNTMVCDMVLWGVFSYSYCQSTNSSLRGSQEPY